MFAESLTLATATASIILSGPAHDPIAGDRLMLSSRPFVSTLAAQGGTYWLFADQQDKRMHAMGCALISSLTTEMTGNPWLGLAAGVTVGFAKEVLDATVFPHGDPSFHLDGDFGADLLGSGMGSILYFRF